MDCSVGSVARLRARLRNLCSIPDEDNNFVSYPKLLPVGSVVVLPNTCPGGEEGIKASEHEVDHSPACSSVVGICLCLFLILDSTQFFFVCRGA
jgi:hypothetical protein